LSYNPTNCQLVSNISLYANDRNDFDLVKAQPFMNDSYWMLAVKTTSRRINIA
jgi:hypothetical protein